MNAIPFRLTYKLSDREQTVPVMNEGDPVPNINTYPILNEAKAQELYSVGTEHLCIKENRFRNLFSDQHQNVPDSERGKGSRTVLGK